MCMIVSHVPFYSHLVSSFHTHTTSVVAVERVQQYHNIPGEAPRLSSADHSLALNWPTEGKIEFINAKLKYRPGLPLVLKGLNISIPAHAKVGVVGRTGKNREDRCVYYLSLDHLISQLYHPCVSYTFRGGKIYTHGSLVEDCRVVFWFY